MISAEGEEHVFRSYECMPWCPNRDSCAHVICVNCARLDPVPGSVCE